MVTMLDAHPDVAMSYELYPSLLEPTPDEHSLAVLARSLRTAEARTHVRDVAATYPYRTFLARCSRGGLSLTDIGNMLSEHLEEGLTFNSITERLRFIEVCCRTKARRCGKVIWGLKCSNQFDEYLALWPQARFINMVRDGRDVLASQLNTGSFAPDPIALAKAWVKTHRGFESLQETIGARAIAVSYEKLVHDPALESSRILRALELSETSEILNYHSKQLTIYKSSHLSMESVSEPITPVNVGRWRRDLTVTQVADFESIAGDLLRKFGYLSERMC